jgi:hypothetical protein
LIPKEGSMLGPFWGSTRAVSSAAPSTLGRMTFVAALLAAYSTTGAVFPQSPAVPTLESASANKRLPSKEVHGDLVTIRGQVLTPDGRPADGATVWALRPLDGRLPVEPPNPSTHTRPDGSFEFSYPKSQLDDGIGGRWKQATIVATLLGFGPQWTFWPDVEADQPLVLKLVADFPIHGRVVDLEGKPLAGVHIGVMTLEQVAEKNLDARLAAMKADPSGRSRNRAASNMLGVFPEIWDSSVTTKADGRFTLAGVGAERFATLDFRGPTIAYSMADVATRASIPRLLSLRSRLGLFSAEFTLSAPPTRPVVGTVRDAATGEPVAGVSVGVSSAGTFWIRGRVRAETDAKGHYELRGMPEREECVLDVRPNDSQPYLMQDFEIEPKQAGQGPLTVDVELRRGVWIRGRVTDSLTGKPVAGAFVRYLPLLKNPFTLRRPEFDRRNGRQRMRGDGFFRYRTDSDGKYQLVGLPGPGLVGVVASSRNYVAGVGATKIDVPVKHGQFETYFSWGSGFSRDSENALKEINPPAEARMAWCDFGLVPGESVRLALVDPDGRPISGCMGMNLHKSGIEGREMFMESTTEVNSLTPDETRRIWILHRGRKLGKYLELTPGHRPREITVNLGPCATLTGRVVNGENHGLADLSVDVETAGIGRSWAFGISSGPDGRFAYPYVPVGCEYSVSFFKPQAGSARIVKAGRGTSLSWHEWKIDARQAEPGKSVDLGDVVVEPPKQRVRRRR